MKKFIALAAVMVALVSSCIKPAMPLIHGGDMYLTVKLLDGNTWTIDPLHYIPDGMTVSATATDPICYPQYFENVKTWRDTTIKADTISTIAWKHSEEMKIADSKIVYSSKGLLYDWSMIFGTEITKDNYNTFEGAQGICPDGWHIPTLQEALNLVGKCSDDKLTNKGAAYYKADYDGAKINDLMKDGFNWGYTGNIVNGKYAATNAITPAMTNDKLKVGLSAMTYFATSTGKEPAAGKDATQMYAVASTFSAGTYDKTTKTLPEVGKYPEGRLTVMYANFAKGNHVQVRCVKNK